jgi:uncharacterized membrane protein YfcA
MLPAELSLLDWTVLAIGAVAVGFAKTAVGGAGAMAVFCFAMALPARESTGTLLPLLCLGDVIAVRVYHRHAHWRLLLRLLPGVVPGLALGAWFLSAADDALVRRTIGVVLLAMCLVQLWFRRPRLDLDSPNRGNDLHPVITVAIGIVAGFATMTANAAGPVTTLYLLVAGLPMLEFLGTSAWFYLVVNAIKLPFSAGLSLLTWSAFSTDLALVPALALGALAGVVLIRRIDQARFERVALGLTTFAAAFLLL